MLQNGVEIWTKRRGGHSAMSGADLRHRGPAPIYGSSEVGEVSTDLLTVRTECRRLLVSEQGPESILRRQ